MPQLEQTTINSFFLSFVFVNFDFKITIAPNPASEFIAIQTQMTENDLKVELINELGQNKLRV